MCFLLERCVQNSHIFHLLFRYFNEIELKTYQSETERADLV